MEQNALVWHSGFTEENQQDLERVQKSACKIIMKRKYESYNKALEILDLNYLIQRQNQLCRTFACKASRNSRIIFEPNIDSHTMYFRQNHIYKENFCKTERYKKSAIPSMQVMLNQMV